MATNEDNRSTTRLQIANTVIEGSFKVTVALLGLFTASIGIVVGLINLSGQFTSASPPSPPLPSPTPTVSLSPTPLPEPEPTSPPRFNSSSREIAGFRLITNYCMSTGGSYNFCNCKTTEWRKRYSLDEIVWKLKNDPGIVREGEVLNRICTRY